MPRWYLEQISGSELLEKALRAKRERDDAIAFYGQVGHLKKQTISVLANHEVVTSLGISRGYLFRLLIVAKSPEFIQDFLTKNLIAADTIVDIHFYLKKHLGRNYTLEELQDTYKDLLDLMKYYKKKKIQPLLAEKYFDVGRSKETKKYSELDLESEFRDK